MPSLLHHLGNVRIHPRVGLTLMACAAILPVGLAAIGDLYHADKAVIFGSPFLFLGALAWRGRITASTYAAQNRRVFRQKCVVTLTFAALSASVLVSDWPREIAIEESVTLNQAALHREAVKLRRSFYPAKGRWRFFHPGEANPYNVCAESFLAPKLQVECKHSFRVGFVEISVAQIDEFGTVYFCMEQNDGKGYMVSRRLIYEESEPDVQ